MRIGVVATMTGSPWGGSEELWAAMVREALSHGHHVAISIHAGRAAAPEVAALETLGARVLPRPLPRWASLPYRLKRKLRPPFATLRAFRPAVLCVSQGGTYDAVGEFVADLGPIIRDDSIPYVVRCAANMETPLDATGRWQAYAFLAGAAMVLWGSHRAHVSTERQLGRRLRRVQIVCSPVNLRDTSAVRRVPDARPRFACVARLETSAKGQDLLLEALATDRWRARDWDLGFYGHGRDLDYLRDLATHYALAEKIRFEGHRHDVRAIWAANDLLVLPSRRGRPPRPEGSDALRPSVCRHRRGRYHRMGGGGPHRVRRRRRHREVPRRRLGARVGRPGTLAGHRGTSPRGRARAPRSESGADVASNPRGGHHGPRSPRPLCPRVPPMTHHRRKSPWPG